MKAKVTKLTNIDLLRKANSFTTGKGSKMSLATAYKTMHSPARMQLFWIELYDIPLFVASQLVRSHVGVQFFQRSKRTDRGGEDFGTLCQTLSRIIAVGVHNIKDQSENGMVTDSKDLNNDLENLTTTAITIKELAERFDRYAPTDLAFIINAEALVNLAHKRLCAKASTETRQIVQDICDLVNEQDPDLYPHLVRPCVTCGVCRELKPCGFISTEQYREQREAYKKLFKAKV